jgi:hypothetical protein
MTVGKNARVRMLHMRDEIESLSNELVAWTSKFTGRATPFAGSPNARSRLFPRPRAHCLKNCGRVIPMHLGLTSSPSRRYAALRKAEIHDAEYCGREMDGQRLC